MFGRYSQLRPIACGHHSAVAWNWSRRGLSTAPTATGAAGAGVGAGAAGASKSKFPVSRIRLGRAPAREREVLEIVRRSGVLEGRRAVPGVRSFDDLISHMQQTKRAAKLNPELYAEQLAAYNAAMNERVKAAAAGAAAAPAASTDSARDAKAQPKSRNKFTGSVGTPILPTKMWAPPPPPPPPPPQQPSASSARAAANSNDRTPPTPPPARPINASKHRPRSGELPIVTVDTTATTVDDGADESKRTPAQRLVVSAINEIVSSDVRADVPLFPEYMRTELTRRATEELLTKFGKLPTLKFDKGTIESLTFHTLMLHADSLCTSDDDRISLVTPNSPRIGDRINLEEFPEPAIVLRRELKEMTLESESEGKRLVLSVEFIGSKKTLDVAMPLNPGRQIDGAPPRVATTSEAAALTKAEADAADAKAKAERRTARRSDVNWQTEDASGRPVDLTPAEQRAMDEAATRKRDGFGPGKPPPLPFIRKPKPDTTANSSSATNSKPSSSQQ